MNSQVFSAISRQRITKMIKLIVRYSITRPGGEIGRRTGLKILRPSSAMRVQVPPRAPLIKLLDSTSVKSSFFIRNSQRALQALKIACALITGKIKISRTNHFTHGAYHKTILYERHLYNIPNIYFIK